MKGLASRAWIQKVREICARQHYTNNSQCEILAARANSFGGPAIRANNLYTFVQGTHPDGEGLGDEKVERVAWALDYRLELVPKDSVVVPKAAIVELEKAVAALTVTGQELLRSLNCGRVHR